MEKCAKIEKHTVGSGKSRETVKNEKNEKGTLQGQDCGEKTEKTWKMKIAHCRTWNMARKLTKNENQKLTWQDLEYGKKH